MHKKWLRKRGGFTFIEVVTVMALVSFALGGFLVLWSGIAKQEAVSYGERLVDSYGNFLMTRINMDLKNAFEYTLTQQGGIYGVTMKTVDYSQRMSDTMIVTWKVFRNGDASRYSNVRSSNILYRMLDERDGRGFGIDINQHFSKGEVNRQYLESMALVGFRLTPADRIPFSDETYGRLGRTAVQVELSLRYSRMENQLTVQSPERLQRPYVRDFSWKTMVYLRNMYINLMRSNSSIL